MNGVGLLNKSIKDSDAVIYNITIILCIDWNKQTYGSKFICKE